MKRLAWFTFLVLATLLVLLILWQVRLIIGAFLLSLVVAAGVRPLTDRLVALRLPRGLSQILVYLAGIALVVGIFLLFGAPLVDELQTLTNRLMVQYGANYDEWLAANNWLSAVAGRLPAPAQFTEGGSFAPLIMSFLFGATRSLALVAAGALMVLVLSVYWGADQNHFERLWLSLLPVGERVSARAAWRNMEAAVGGYTRSELAQSLLAGILLGLGYYLLGLEFPVILAVIGAVSWLIPLVGVVFIAIPAFLVGLSGGIQLALAAVVLTAVVLAVLEFVVEPRFFDRRRYSSFLVILLVLVLSQTFGLVGLLLAPPIGVALQEGVGQFRQMRRKPAATVAGEQIENLEARYQAVYQSFQEDGGAESAPEMRSILDRLRELLDEAGRLRSTS